MNSRVDSPSWLIRACDTPNDRPSRLGTDARVVRTWNDPSPSMKPASHAFDPSSEVSRALGSKISEPATRFK